MSALIIPDGKKTGCLPRSTRVGERCPLLGDNIRIIPQREWAELIGEVDLRSYVTKIKDQDGVGCHDEKTEVLTTDGWRLWSEYTGSEALATVNQSTLGMEFQHPTELHAYEYSGPMHYLENRSHSISVTPNHRMFRRHWIEGSRALASSYSMCRMDEIGWYSGLLASPRSWCGAEFTGIQIGETHYTGDDFIALSAMIVADGWVSGSERSRNRMSFCCFGAEIDAVRRLAYRTGFHEQPGRPGVFVKSDAALAQWLKSNAYTTGLGATNKRVPAFIKFASERQVNHFLHWFGDKHVSSTGRRAYSTTSKKLADDLQELTLRIGRRAGISSRPMRGTVMRDGRVVLPSGNTEYTIGEWASDRLSIESKKVGIEPYNGMVYCATVPNSTLITRRDGKVLISGNSCATESTSQGVEIVRAFAGQEYVELNPWFIYNTTSGGRDQGSSIDANLEFVRENGIAPESIWPRSKGWKSRPTADAIEAAKEYRIEEFYDITSVDEIGSALLVGFPVVFGWSGHSCVLTKLLSTSEAEYCNSWGLEFGDQGFGRIRLSAINFMYGAFAIRTASWVAK